MLTPLEIHNKEFKRIFRGYDEDEVDEFLDQVIADYEQLYRENIDLREIASKAEGNTGQYKDLEDTLKNALVVAQQTSDQMKANAGKEAQMIIQEASVKADQIVSSAQDKFERIVSDYERLKNQVTLFRVKLKSFLEMQIALVDEYGEGMVKENNSITENHAISSEENQQTLINDVNVELAQLDRLSANISEFVGITETPDSGQDASTVPSEKEELNKINTYDFQKHDEPVSQNTIIFSKEEVAAAIDDNTTKDNTIF